MKRIFGASGLIALAALPALAGDVTVAIAGDTPVAEPRGGAMIRRRQDTQATIAGEFARTSRPCPDFCVQPTIPADGVTPIGEMELIAMLQDAEPVVIDSRVQSWYAQGAIPGAVHMPYTRIVDHLAELGCEIDFEGWIRAAPRTVALFCNGPWWRQSPTAIRKMIAAGYPAEKIGHYRAGMQGWQVLGLTDTGGS